MITIETRGESVILTTDQAGPVTMTTAEAWALIAALKGCVCQAEQEIFRKQREEHHNKELARLRERHPDAVEVTGKDGLTYLAKWRTSPEYRGRIEVYWPTGRPEGVSPTLPARWLVPYNKRTAHRFTGPTAICGEEEPHLWTEPKPTAKRCPKCAQGEP